MMINPCPFRHYASADFKGEHICKVVWDRNFHFCFVECDCAASGPLMYSELEAISAWNSAQEKCDDA